MLELVGHSTEALLLEELMRLEELGLAQDKVGSSGTIVYFQTTL